MSAAGRKRIAEATRKQWAEFRAKKAAAKQTADNRIRRRHGNAALVARQSLRRRLLSGWLYRGLGIGRNRRNTHRLFKEWAPVYSPSLNNGLVPVGTPRTNAVRVAITTDSHRPCPWTTCRSPVVSGPLLGSGSAPKPAPLVDSTLARRSSGGNPHPPGSGRTSSMSSHHFISSPTSAPRITDMPHQVQKCRLLCNSGKPSTWRRDDSLPDRSRLMGTNRASRPRR